MIVFRTPANADDIFFPHGLHKGKIAMRLTTYTDYSLRVLMHLAVRPGELRTIAEIANTYAISENHLTKIVHQLGLAGYVETVRGRNGGIRLLRQPQTINVGEVVRRTEPDFDLVPCFNGSAACVIEPACILKAACAKARDAFLAVLATYTLADLVAPRLRLDALLNPVI